MKTLVCLEQPPLFITKPSPWNSRSPSLHSTSMTNPYLSTRRWKLHAEAKGAKGFAASPVNKRPQNETATRKNSGRNKDDEEDDKIPDVVFERMIVRILFYVGVPMAVGLALLQIFGVMKDQHLWDVPLWLPFLTTLLTFGASALGIAYGTLSTSWDPEKKGSLLGLEEAQKNWADVWREEDD